VASGADAAWYPVFTPSYIQLRPGATATLDVHGAWLSGIALLPFQPMTFTAEDPTVATIEGSLPTTHMAQVRITARSPGVTRVSVVERFTGGLFPTSAVIVVADRELPVSIRVDGDLTAGKPITLHAVSDEPDATFTWYEGRLGGLFAWPTSTGREFSFEPAAGVVYEYWVLMTAPGGAGASGVTVAITKPPARRRSVRR
jgi:hypothetical protein